MLRHCTMAELLEIRDGEGSAAARAHLKGCAACRVELERVHQRVAGLKALPSFSAPRDRWPAVREALSASRRRVRFEWVGWATLAAAAALVLLVGVRGVTSGGSETLADREVAALVQESQELEEFLRSVPVQGRVVDGATALTIADIEDRIGFVDLGIERAQAAGVSRDEMADLWRERVALMGQLVQTHVQQAAYVGF